MRLYHLGFKSYWLDEAVSIDLARAPWWLFSKAVRTSEANMVLYYSLLRPWVRIGGVDESWVRLLSCLFGVATVPALYAIGLRLFDRVTALLACGILALNAGHVWASQEGRSYALLVMLTTTSWWLLLRAADQRRGIRAVGPWALYVTVAALATYAHFYAVLVLAAQGVTLLFLPLPAGHAAANQPAPRARVSPGIVVACGAAIAALLWPLALFLTRPHHNIDWISNGGRGFDVTLSIIDRMIGSIRRRAGDSTSCAYSPLPARWPSLERGDAPTWWARVGAGSCSCSGSASRSSCPSQSRWSCARSSTRGI